MPTRTPTTARSRIALTSWPAIGLALTMGACSAPDVGFRETPWSPAEAPWQPFSASNTVVVSDGLTVQRVRGYQPEVAPVLPEAGDVWPTPEAPRPTLMSGPEEAMRNIPEYRPSLIQGAPPARSPVPTPGIPGSSAPGGLEPAPPAYQPRSSAPRPVSPPAQPRTEGQVLIDPSGRPAVTTGDAGRVRGVTQPNIGGGAVIRDGNVETWIGPDGRTHTRVVPPQ
jgi:hypothetical protein